MNRTILLGGCAFLFATGVSGAARAQIGPDGRSGYVTVYGDMMRNLGGVGTDGPTGGSVDWGSFQNKYVAAGTKLGLWGGGTKTGLPRQLFFGGGAQFHIPIGSRFLIIPALNLGFLLLDAPVSGTSYEIAAYLSLGAAYRLNRFYFGLEGERPIYLPLPNESSSFFPPLTTVAVFAGVYY